MFGNTPTISTTRISAPHTSKVSLKASLTGRLWKNASKLLNTMLTSEHQTAIDKIRESLAALRGFL
jgi:hypothetical protein